MAVDNQTLLDEVTEAISAILTRGQSYTIDTGDGARTYNRGNLHTLIAAKGYLEAEVEREKKGGIAPQYGVPQ